MTPERVQAIYAEELERCKAAPATEALRLRTLLDEIVREQRKANNVGNEKALKLLQQRRDSVVADMEAPLLPAEHYAWQATRTRVHEALQAEKLPPHHNPDLHARDADEDPDDVHEDQKRHFKNLWKKADKLVAAAGITKGGLR